RKGLESSRACRIDASKLSAWSFGPFFGVFAAAVAVLLCEHRETNGHGERTAPRPCLEAARRISLDFCGVQNPLPRRARGRM
ncbi:unnamed protein product, partial [Amoebophrya sp. A120]